MSTVVNIEYIGLIFAFEKQIKGGWIILNTK